MVKVMVIGLLMTQAALSSTHLSHMCTFIKGTFTDTYKGFLKDGPFQGFLSTSLK